MLINNVEVDVKTKCIENQTTQLKIAEAVGSPASYVNRLIKKPGGIVISATSAAHASPRSSTAASSPKLRIFLSAT